MKEGQKHIYPISDKLIDRESRSKFLGQNGCVLWFTGLSGSGKSTIAIALEKRLMQEDIYCVVLDGDNIRSGINSDLTFTVEDRQENIRRISEIAKLFAQSSVVTITSFISPTIEMRAKAKDIIGEEDFLEVFIDTPLEICESRDVKGLYAKARKGEIKNFTGIDSPYESPTNPAVHIKTADKSVDECVDDIIKAILKRIKK